ncbi:MAG: hypothetical protein P1U88_12420 [Thalassobaculaceae bacterium]|nr:hypothetical protein [Thalassobaculaceae bacterium]
MKTTRVSKSLVGIMVGGSLLSAAVAAQAQDVTMSVVTGSPPKHIISQGVEHWMGCVTKAQGDKVAFSYYPAGQLVSLRELQPGLEDGVADSVPIPVGYASEKLPLNGVSMLPGMGSSATAIISTYSSMIRNNEALAEEYAKINAVPLWVLGFPPYQIVSSGPAIRTLEDFKGKVIRSAGGTLTLTIETLGAAPAEIVVADLYVSMQRGTVDGTISGINSVKPYNVQELMKSMSLNGAFGTFANVFAVNADVWAGIPSGIQSDMRQCGADTEAWLSEKMDSESSVLAEEFKAMGIDMFEFSSDELAALNDALSTVHADWTKRLEDRGLPAAKVLEAYRAELAKQ